MVRNTIDPKMRVFEIIWIRLKDNPARIYAMKVFFVGKNIKPAALVIMS